MLTTIGLLALLRLVMWKCFPQFGRGEYADVLFGLVALTTITLYWLKTTRSQVHAAIVALLMTSVLSFFWSSAPVSSLKYIFLLNAYILCFLIAVKEMKFRDQIKSLWAFLMFGAALSAAQGIIDFVILRTQHFPASENQAQQFIFIMRRACSFQGWPNSFAGYMLLFIPAAVTYALRVRTWTAVAFVVFLLFGFCSAMSFLAMVSLAVAAVFILPRLTQNPWMLIGSVIALAAGLGIALANKDVAVSFATRIEYYEYTFKKILEHPFIGSGLGSFFYAGVSKTAFAHNSYLQVWVETGIIGFSAILALVYRVLKTPVTNDWLEIGVYWGLLAFFIDNLFSYTLLKPNLSFAFWLTLAVFIGLQKIKGLPNGSIYRH